ncbi:hypothetical protein BCAR13_560129 [Paraburkholderia caribensis]|nr:hypothetical protein BCAR13_560129 [Paraburkholderia caribensis]
MGPRPLALGRRPLCMGGGELADHASGLPLGARTLGRAWPELALGARALGELRAATGD